MKHMVNITKTKPATAEEVAWIQLKDILPLKNGFALHPQQQQWLALQLDNLKQG